MWAGALADIDRVTAIWRDCLAAYGGPFLFGQTPGMADAMYAPVCTRFLTYDVELDPVCASYCDAIMALPAMKEWMAAAKAEHEEVDGAGRGVLTMVKSAYVPAHVHLVGSIGLDSVEEVFATVGRMLGARLKRIPDGEPGSRRLWISFQYPMLRASPFLRPDPSGALRKTSGFPLLCLAEGVGADELRFGELGYAREARASYLDFCAARERGEIAAGVRFQVCLPTPMSVIYAFCTARDVVAIEAAYERSMIREAAAIARAIPHRDLAIQWDVCHDMIIWDGAPQDQFPLVNASKAEIAARIARLSAAVPVDVELGFHLCYGDFGGKHFFDPVDAASLVEIANAFAAGDRPPDHLYPHAGAVEPRRKPGILQAAPRPAAVC